MGSMLNDRRLVERRVRITIGKEEYMSTGRGCAEEEGFQHPDSGDGLGLRVTDYRFLVMKCT
jgi:hypothetical protein